ncbi:MAG: hypothetical protein II794_04915 [Oscillospiraceae bacterium]|nr:hypothetical protein [Oscillospiraceae bacterium]
MKRIIKLLPAILLAAALLIAVAVTALATGDLAEFYDITRMIIETDIMEPQTVRFTLNEATWFDGKLYPPTLTGPTLEEVNRAVAEVMREMNVTEKDLQEFTDWAWKADSMVELEGFKKLINIVASFIPGNGAQAVTTVYGGVSGIADTVQTGDTSGILWNSHDNAWNAAFGAMQEAQIHTKLANFGANTISVAGALREAADTSQYEKFVKESDGKFAKAAVFYARCTQKLRAIIAEKNKNHQGARIEFDNVMRDGDFNKTLYGVNKLRLTYSLNGTLAQQGHKETGGFYDLAGDVGGYYKGVLTLKGWLNEYYAAQFDSRFFGENDLWNGPATECEEWMQIMKLYYRGGAVEPDFFRKAELGSWTDKTVTPTSLERTVAGELTVEIIVNKDGTLSVGTEWGSMNDQRDEIYFAFDHELHFLWARPVERFENGRSVSYGFPTQTASIKSTVARGADGKLGSTLSELYVSVTRNKAQEVWQANDAAFVMFGGGGRNCAVPPGKIGNIWQDFEIGGSFVIPRE